MTPEPTHVPEGRKFVIIHVYMGTAVVRGGFRAKTQHRLWYARITGK
jgi:hypothetical protein